MTPKWLTDCLEKIDAGMFLGDTFHEKSALGELEPSMARWNYEIERRKKHDSDAMDEIQRPLDEKEWSAETVDQIADIVRSTGREIGAPK
jgi:hypothetical protein